MLGKLYQILKLMETVSELWDQLTPEQQEYFDKMHNEQYSLGYCIRWGNQAAEECLDGVVGDMEVSGKTFKVGKNQIYLDKTAGVNGEYVVEKYEYSESFGGSKSVLMYSVVDGFDMLTDAIERAMRT